MLFLKIKVIKIKINVLQRNFKILLTIVSNAMNLLETFQKGTHQIFPYSGGKMLIKQKFF